MPKYKCENIDCKVNGQTVYTFGTKIRIINGEAVDENRFCPVCNKPREVVREPGMTINIAGTNDQRNRMAKQF
jgi:hypothetical protein